MNYTSIEQSNKLLELGLSPESADMTYCAITEGMRERMIIKDWQVNIGLDIAIKENRFSYKNGYVVPCWSLGALLEVMPIIKKGIDEYLPYFIKGSEIWKGKIQSFWYCSYALLDDSNTELITFRNSTAVEAAYSMVAWLLENGFIKKEPKTFSK